MADESKLLEQDVTSDPRLQSEQIFEEIHSKSPVFFDRYERKSELKHQTH